jgi:hypothetical protein
MGDRFHGFLDSILPGLPNVHVASYNSAHGHALRHPIETSQARRGVAR